MVDTPARSEAKRRLWQFGKALEEMGTTAPPGLFMVGDPGIAIYEESLRNLKGAYKALGGDSPGEPAEIRPGITVKAGSKPSISAAAAYLDSAAQNANDLRSGKGGELVPRLNEMIEMGRSVTALVEKEAQAARPDVIMETASGWVRRRAGADTESKSPPFHSR